jgi:hypothetical protein
MHGFESFQHLECLLVRFVLFWSTGDGVPDMGLYYFKSEEAHKNGDPPSGRVELLGVKVSTEEEAKTGETVMVLDSDFREIKCALYPPPPNTHRRHSWLLRSFLTAGSCSSA